MFEAPDKVKLRTPTPDQSPPRKKRIIAPKHANNSPESMNNIQPHHRSTNSKAKTKAPENFFVNVDSSEGTADKESPELWQIKLAIENIKA